MKTLLISLNSKFIHFSLAPWYLKAACGNEHGTIKVMEFTINDSLEGILAAIFKEKADVAAFSCYIWNMSLILKLVEDLKKVSPNLKIILGGPEVSYDAEKLMEEHGYIDFIIAGEGELSFPKLLDYLNNSNKNIQKIEGLAYRHENSVIFNNVCAVIENLDFITSPYTNEMLESLDKRIAYFEASRGCPFSCSYCLSSISKGVRYFSMDRVKGDLKKLMGCGVKQIKFVDRTFNSSKARAKEIFEFIIDFNKGIDYSNINFHFEAAADLFDEEMFEILSHAPAGLIQFEIGVQTTNAATLEAIDRKTDLDKVFQNVRRIKALNNIHVHLDLIAGLPEEDYNSFKKSFDNIYELKPQQLQLGFLKMLKGSKIRSEAEKYKYEYRSYPPYEVLGNKYITFDEMLELKGIEELVERYYNSGRFIKSIKFLLEKYFNSSFDFYHEFMVYIKENGFFERSIPSRELYTVLLDYLKIKVELKDLTIFNDLLKFDFLSSDSSNNLPAGLERELKQNFKESCFEFLKDERNVAQYLYKLEGISAKEIYKQVHFEIFNSGRQVILFDYSKKDKVTGLFKSFDVSEDF